MAAKQCLAALVQGNREARAAGHCSFVAGPTLPERGSARPGGAAQAKGCVGMRCTAEHGTSSGVVVHQERELDGESTTPADRAFHRDRATVLLYDVSCDGEAQPHTGYAPAG